MMSMVSFSVMALAAASVNAAPWSSSSKVVDGGHNTVNSNKNTGVDLSNLDADIDVLDVLKRGRWNKKTCHGYFKSCNRNGGHNTVNTNKNTLIDASDLTLLVDVLSRDGSRRSERIPKACVTYVKSYNAGHNTVNSNKNSLIDLSSLFADVDILNKRNAPSYHTKSYNGGHNTVNDNENSLVDLSGLDLVANVLDARNAPSYHSKSYNGGHNTVNDNKNSLVDLSDLDLFADILKRHFHSESSYHNGGFNTLNSNDNSLVDGKNIGVFADVLKRNIREWGYDGGHNTVNKNENSLVDLKNLDVFADILKRDYNDQDCICRPKAPSNCGGTPPGVHTPSQPKPTWTKTRTHTQTATPRPSKPTCQDSWTYINEGHNVVNSNKNTLLDLSNLDLDVDILGDVLGGAPQRKTVKGNWKCTSKYGCCAKAPTVGSCSGGATFINKGHNVVNKNENSLIDLSNLSLDIDILDFSGNRVSKKGVKGDWQCDSPYGCCGRKAPSCPSGTTYYNGGHNVYNSNHNSAVDLSNLTLDISILGLGNSDSKKEKNGAYKCQSQWGCCAKVVDGGHNTVNSNSNSLVDASGITAGVHVLDGLNGGKGNGGLLGKGGLLGTGLL